MRGTRMRLSANLDMGMILTPRAHLAGDYSDSRCRSNKLGLTHLVVASDSSKLPVDPVKEIHLIAG